MTWIGEKGRDWTIWTEEKNKRRKKAREQCCYFSNHKNNKMTLRGPNRSRNMTLNELRSYNCS
jgi:hypothetical protein